MPHRRSLLVLIAVVALSAFVLLPAGAAGEARGCHGLHLHSTRHRAANGGSVRIFGRVCPHSAHRGHVLIFEKGAHGWHRRAKVAVGGAGHFSRRVGIGSLGSVAVARLRAVQRSRRSNAVEVRLAGADRGIVPTTARPTAKKQLTTNSTAGAPVAVAAPPANCSSTEPQPTVAMTMPGCQVIASDTAAKSDPLSFWGAIECASASRYSYESSGGDPSPTATGAPQPDAAYRKLTVDDGDDFWGERCELGENNYDGPTAFYHEGQRRVTYYSERLPSNFPIDTSAWQTVMQMKQAEPMHDGNVGVALEMQVMNGRWYVLDRWTPVFSFPAQAGTWTRFAWDVYYSSDPSQGWLQVSADLNGDGDFEDPGERSPVIHMPTLATEVPGYPADGIAPGASIPSHLRLGIYHDPVIACPAPTGCSVDVDNVQVLG